MLGDWTTWLVQDRIAGLHRQVERERVARTVQRGSRSRRTRSRRWQGWAGLFQAGETWLKQRQPTETRAGHAGGHLRVPVSPGEPAGRQR
jgi:hypothetical protein